MGLAVALLMSAVESVVAFEDLQPSWMWLEP
jgi:hypothetical protein